MESFVFNNFKERFFKGEVKPEDKWTALMVNSKFEEMFDTKDVSIEQFRNKSEMELFAKRNNKKFTDVQADLRVIGYEYTRDTNSTGISKKEDKPTFVTASSWPDFAEKFGDSLSNRLHTMIFGSPNAPNEADRGFGKNGFYWVTNVNELQWVADRVNGDENGKKGPNYNNKIAIVLGDDIGVDPTFPENIEATKKVRTAIRCCIGKYPDRPFEGVFFGNGFYFCGIELICNNDDNGIFGTIGKDGVVESLYVTGHNTLNCEKKINIGHIKNDGNDVYSGLICGRNYGTIRRCQVQGTLEIKNFVPNVYPTRNKVDNAETPIGDGGENQFWPAYMCIDNPGNIIPYAGYFNEGLIASVFTVDNPMNNVLVDASNNFNGFKEWGEWQFKNHPFDSGHNVFDSMCNLTGVSACCLLYNFDEIKVIAEEYEDLNGEGDFNIGTTSAMGLMSYCGPYLTEANITVDSDSSSTDKYFDDYVYENNGSWIYKNVYNPYPLSCCGNPYGKHSGPFKQVATSYEAWPQYKNYGITVNGLPVTYQQVLEDGTTYTRNWRNLVYNNGDQFGFEREQFECPWADKPTKMAQSSRAGYYQGGIAGWNAGTIEESNVNYEVNFAGTFVGFYGGVVGKLVRGTIHDVVSNLKATDNYQRTLYTCIDDEGNSIGELINLHFDKWPFYHDKFETITSIRRPSETPKKDSDNPLFNSEKNIIDTTFKARTSYTESDAKYIHVHNLAHVIGVLAHDSKQGAQGWTAYQGEELRDAYANTGIMIRTLDAGKIEIPIDWSKVPVVGHDAYNLGLNLNGYPWKITKQACEYTCPGIRQDPNKIEDIADKIATDWDHAAGIIEVQDTEYAKNGVQDEIMKLTGYMFGITDKYKLYPDSDKDGLRLCQTPWPFGLTMAYEWDAYINGNNTTFFNNDFTKEGDYYVVKDIDFALPHMINFVLDGLIESNTIDNSKYPEFTVDGGGLRDNCALGMYVSPFSGIDIVDSVPFGEIDDMVNYDDPRPNWISIGQMEDKYEFADTLVRYGARRSQFIFARQTIDDLAALPQYANMTTTDSKISTKLDVNNSKLRNFFKKILTPKMHVGKLYLADVGDDITATAANDANVVLQGKNLKIVKMVDIEIKHIMNFTLPYQSDMPKCRWDSDTIRFMYANATISSIESERIFNIRNNHNDYTFKDINDTFSAPADSSLGQHIIRGYDYTCPNFETTLKSIHNVGGIAGSLVYGDMNVYNTSAHFDNQIAILLPFDNTNNVWDYNNMHHLDYYLLNRYGTLAPIMELNSNYISDWNENTWERKANFANVTLKYTETELANLGDFWQVGPMAMRDSSRLGIAAPVIAEMKPTYHAVPSILSYNNSWLSHYGYGKKYKDAYSSSMMTSYGDQKYGLYSHELCPIFDNYNQFGWTYDMNIDMPIRNVFDWSRNFVNVPGILDYKKYTDVNRTDKYIDLTNGATIYPDGTTQATADDSRNGFLSGWPIADIGNKTVGHLSNYYMFDANPTYVMAKLFNWQGFAVATNQFGYVTTDGTPKTGRGFGYSTNPEACVHIPYEAVHNRYKMSWPSNPTTSVLPLMWNNNYLETFKYSKQSNTYNIMGSSLEIIKNFGNESLITNHVVKSHSCYELNQSYKNVGITDASYKGPYVKGISKIYDYNLEIVRRPSRSQLVGQSNEIFNYTRKATNKGQFNSLPLDVKYDIDDKTNKIGYWLYDPVGGFSGHECMYANNVLHVGYTMNPRSIRRKIEEAEAYQPTVDEIANELNRQYENEEISFDEATKYGAYTSAISGTDFQGIYITDSAGNNVMYIDTHVGDAEGLESWCMDLDKHSSKPCGLLLEVE